MAQQRGRRMTYQEANALVDDFSFVYKGKSIPKEALIECREIIHNALEKQIPRKFEVIENIDNTPGMQECYCPNCGKFVVTLLYGCEVFENSYKQKYCDNCGQALDFGDLNGIY